MYYDALQEVEDKIDNKPSGDIDGPYNLYYETYIGHIVPVTVSIPGNIKYVVVLASTIAGYGIDVVYNMNGRRSLSGSLIRITINNTNNTIKIQESNIIGDQIIEKIWLYAFYY